MWGNEPCPATGKARIVWTNEKIQELRQRLGYVIPHLVKKTFDNYTQYYPGVSHEREVMPKKSSVVRFPSLSGPMRGIRHNKETFSITLLENTHAGKKHWGLVFYGVKYKLLACYRLGSKDPTSHSTLDALGSFIAEHVIPRMIIMDRDGVIGAGKKWKHYPRRIFTPLRLSEQDKHNQNPVERAIQNLKAGLSKIRNYCGAGFLAYHCEPMEYLCHINN